MRELHLSPIRAGRGRGEGKMLLGLTLLGLSFVPGVQSGLAGGLSGIGEGIAGAGGAELGGLLGSRLLGGAGAWLMLSGASEALAPQARRPAGAPSTAVAPQTPTGEGAAIPLVYGTARVEAPPVVSAGLSVKAMQP
jgi:predicted phage tail protein